MQREIRELETELYQSCGSVLYCLRPFTRASCVILGDGSDVETRLALLERGLAANTTTRFVDNIGQRDALGAVIPGDRVLVEDATADPNVLEGSALYIWLPAKGWVLVWQKAGTLDLSGLAGEGLYLDAAGRLAVNWRLMSPEALALALGGLAGNGLELDEKLDVNWEELPQALFEERLARLMSADFMKGDKWYLRPLVPEDLPLAEIAGEGLLLRNGQLAVNWRPFNADEISAPQWGKLALGLAGSGLVHEDGKLALSSSGLSAAQKRAFLEHLCGIGLSIDGEGRLCADSGNLPEERLAAWLELMCGGPLHIDENGRLNLRTGKAEKDGELPVTGHALWELAQALKEAAEAGEGNRKAIALLNDENAMLHAWYGELRGENEERREETGELGRRLNVLANDCGEREDALECAINERAAEMAALRALASATASGLMSAEDFVKLSGIEAGAERNPDLSGYATSEEMERALAAKHGKGEAVENSMTIKGISPSLVLDSQNPNAPDDNSDWINMLLFRLLGKNLANIAIFKNDGLPSFSFRIYFNDTSKSFTMGLRNVNGAACRTFWLDTPPADDNTGTAATTGWVRARIASATGKAATAFALAQAEQPGPDLASAESCAWQAEQISPAMAEAARQAIKKAVSAEIFAGFSFVIQGQGYFFTYDLYDQQNIADAAILALQDQGATVFARDQSGQIHSLELAPAEAKNLHQYASMNHKGNIMAQGLEMTRKCAAAPNRAELEEFLKAKGFFEDYRNILQSFEEE